MGLGMYVGRVGALAVALGIGAAVTTGQGSAWADTTDTDSSTTSSASAGTSNSEKPSDTGDSAATTPSSTTEKSDDDDTPKRKKRSRVTQSTTDTPKKRLVSVDDDAPDDEPRTLSTTKPEPKAAVVKDDDDADVAPVVTTATVAPVAHKQVDTKKPEDPVTVGISSFITALVSPSAGKDADPATPAGGPAVWTLAAAARREFQDDAPTLDKAADQTTNALAAVTETAEEDAPEPVVAVPVTPILTQFHLQELPIIGPLAITPAIAIVHSIPLIGDLLHPIIGYPLGMTGGTTPRDVKVISFDGTPIYVHFFPAQGDALGTRAPTILNGPGLGLPGETNPLAVDNPFLPNQVVGMGTLLQNGYNVVTWDPRGEWGSKAGTLEIDHPDVEARDMQAIISWVAQQSEAAFDEGSTTDPLIGMVGASYGGGIQLVTAARDKRVDAIVPTIAWNNLNTALNKNGAPKTSWGLLLGAALLFTGANTDRAIFPTLLDALFTGRLSDEQVDFLDERGPDYVLDQIEAPTLLVEGTVDTLFTLAEAHENALVLMDNGVPTKVVWYCGGHGGCITSTNNGDVVDRSTMAWLDKYVKGLPVDTGAQFEWVDQHGTNFSSDIYPVTPGTAIEATKNESDTLPLSLFFGGSGPNFAAFGGGPINGLLGFLSGAKAQNAVELTTDPLDATTYLVGAPQLSFTYSGTGNNDHVYAQLVDDSTGLVLGNHVTPIAVTLDGQEHTASLPLEMIAHTLAPGQTVTLQIVSSAVTYQPLKGGGSMVIKDIDLTLPTADPTKITISGDVT